MTELLVGIAAAMWLGLLTAISPCPMATNLAAVAYIGRKVESPSRVLLGGLLYALGRMTAYSVLAIALVAGSLSLPWASFYFQKYAHLVLGPFLILIGMFFVGLIQLPSSGAGVSESLQRRVDRFGIWGALLLGVVFALSFCPTSAAWFFGLVALILGAEAGTIHAELAKIGIVLPNAPVPGGVFVLPLVYGLGTALPVVALAAVLAYSAQRVGRAYNALARVEWWARRATGGVFIALGLYFSLKYVFEVL